VSLQAPFVCHSEGSEESDHGQDTLHVSIPILNNLTEIASADQRQPRKDMRVSLGTRSFLSLRAKRGSLWAWEARPPLRLHAHQ
jgi:hypothetical protein